MELKEGSQFTSNWFEGIVTVEEIDIDSNILGVLIVTPEGSEWREGWNLEHTDFGFTNGDYKEYIKP